ACVAAGKYSRSGLTPLACLVLRSALEVPVTPVPLLQHLLGGAKRRGRRLLHAQRVADLVDAILIGGGHAAAHRFLARALRALPVRVQVARGRRGSGLVVLEHLAEQAHRSPLVVRAFPPAPGGRGPLSPAARDPADRRRGALLLRGLLLGGLRHPPLRLRLPLAHRPPPRGPRCSGYHTPRFDAPPAVC